MASNILEKVRRWIDEDSVETTLEKAIMDGSLKIEGRREAFAEFMGLLDTFPFWFNIVTP